MEKDARDPDCVTSIIDTGLPVSSSSTHAHIILLLQHVPKAYMCSPQFQTSKTESSCFRDVPDKNLLHIQCPMFKKTPTIPKDFFARQTTHDIPARESQRLNKLF